MTIDLTVIPDPDLARVPLEAIRAAIPWVNRDGAPRDECFMSTGTATYTYGRGKGERTYAPVPYPPLVGVIRELVGTTLSLRHALAGGGGRFDYEACFANLYIDGSKHLGWHADDSPSIDHSVGIAVVSFGAERELWVRDLARPLLQKILLPHGSLLYMPPGMQQTHEHRIPRHSAACGPRVSLTFRKLLGAP